MYFCFNLISASRFGSVYEGAETPTPSDPAGGSSPSAEGNSSGDPSGSSVSGKVKFDVTQQAYVNTLLANERRKLQTKNEELITQLETQKLSASTTAAEKDALETRIETLRNEFATKEEMAKKDTDKRIKDLETAKTAAQKKADTNWNLFADYKVKNDLTQAGVQGKAFDPEQIVAILGPAAKLVEETGDGGKPTGIFTTRVRLPGTNKDGQSITLDLSPPEAVKYLSEKPEKYGNLFVSGANGGLGGGTQNRNTDGNPDPSKMSTAEYMAYRSKERKGKRSGQ